MIFLFWKYAKLNIFLISVHKPKTTNEAKQIDYQNFKIKRTFRVVNRISFTTLQNGSSFFGL